MELTNKELADMYIKYKQQVKYYNQSQSFYDLNKYLESKKYLSIVKMEMHKRGLKKKEAKKLGNYNEIGLKVEKNARHHPIIGKRPTLNFDCYFTV